MTDIPEIRGGGHLPMGAARNTWGRHAIDWTTVRMIEAMIIGIDTEIDDPVVGLIPANEPLTLEQAARAVGMKPSPTYTGGIEGVTASSLMSACIRLATSPHTSSARRPDSEPS